jgi:hypothetical protein
VDNVLYSCDFSEKMGPPQPALGPSKFNPLVSTIREIVDKRRGIRRKLQEAEDEATPAFMAARSGKVKFGKNHHELLERKLWRTVEDCCFDVERPI